MEKADIKKIVVLSSHTPSLFWFRMDMMQGFREHGYKVFALGNEEEEKWRIKFEKVGIVYQQIKVQRNGINPYKDMETLCSIKKKLRVIQPDKIFTFQAKTVIYGGIAARMLGINEVYPLIAGMGSVFLKDDLRTRIIRKIMTIEYKISMKKSPVVFFQNQEDEKIFRNNRIIQKQCIVYLPGSGVNTEKFSIQPFPETFGFLCISRLIKDKGVYEYLEACQKIKKYHPNVRCMLVGPYDTNPSALKPEELQAFIEDGTIEYFGEQEDVRPYIAQCHVFVLPSYREGTPKTNLEAMAVGRAVITTDTPGCRETVVNRENGYLVPVKDVDTLVERMENLINNPELIFQMAKAGRKRAEEIFDVKIVNNKIFSAMNI